MMHINKNFFQLIKKSLIEAPCKATFIEYHPLQKHAIESFHVHSIIY
jgi:hypothetical protein